MESQCCVLGCTDSKDEKIKLHRFPFGDHLLLPIWIMATNRTNWMPNANSRMCDKHFTIDDYVSGNRNNRLKPNACPIITPSTSTVYSNTLHVDDSASDNHFSDGKSYDSSDCDSPNTSDLIISDDSSLFSDSSMDVCSVLGDSNDVEHSDDEKKNTIKPEQEEDAISISSYITNYDDTDRIPVQKCAVTLCNQKARNQFDKLFYINFPVENETLSDSWWTLCGQQTDFDRTAKICSIHFDAADFVNKTIQKDGQIYRQTSLKNDSVVPSLYLSAEDYYRFSKKRKRKADKIDESNVKKMSIENYKCPVTNCTKTSLDENINFFTFPTGDQLKLKFWLKSLKMPGWKPLDTDRICSDHFESDQIIKTHNVYQLTSNAKPVFKPKKPFVMPTIKNNNTTNKKKSDKRVIKQPGIKVSYQRISPDCIVVNEVDLTQDGCEVNSNKCTTSSAHADKLEKNETLKEDKDQTGSENKTSILLEIIRDLAPEKYTKEDTCVNDETQELVPEISVTEDKEELSSRNINYLEYIYTDTPLVLIQECVVDDTVDNETQELVLEKCTEETTVNCKSQELASDKYVEDITGNDETQVLMLEKGALEDTEKTEYSKSNNQFEYIHTDTPLEFIQECVVETSIDDETEVFVAGKCIIQDKEENELVNNKSHLEYVHTNTPLKFIQECEVETIVNKKTPLLLPEKHTDETTTENTESQVIVSEKCTIDTSNNSEIQDVVLENSIIQENTVKDNKINQDNVNLPVSNDKNTEQSPVTHNKKRLRSTKSRLPENHTDETTTTENTENQEIVHENSLTQENKCTVEVDKNNRDNVNLYSPNDKNNELLPITRSKKRLRNTKSRLQGKKGKNDKEENELVNNKSHLEYVHTDTPLKFIQECEVETIVNKKTPLLLPEKHTDETTTENTESQVKVSEKCTTETSLNAETQEVVLENSFIQENTVKDNKNNQDNVNLCTSNDKNTEQLPITRNKKSLRNTKSKSLGKRVKSGIPECTHLVHDQELPDFMKESLLLLDKDYDLYVSDSEPCASIDGVPEDEYANAITYIKTIPRVLSSYDVPNKSRKQFFVTTISVDYIYKGYSEEYSKNGKSPPYTKQQFVQIYNQYTKSFVHNV
ncbi:protein PF3D7_1417600-like isoform X5 [Adelges cooleyi]|uniref:protein PF3D7_1417600-like isoform X5 n=1 Tax=Adelges cooleyi TaxID=133065 RepID=UPI00217F7262|nr:protein PF3D7_1417600-like isoform X5 [Adelges cooleyi]